jgi:hypothetical protein
MTAEAKQCPRCGSAYAGGFYYECGSSESTGKWFDESIYCLRAQLSALTARVAELEGERERLSKIGELKPFAESDFVVTFFGEAPDSRIVRTWEGVLDYIDQEIGAKDDGYSVRDPDWELHAPDHWTHLDICIDGGEDTRHTFSQSEFVYCVGISIVRLLSAALAPPAPQPSKEGK